MLHKISQRIIRQLRKLLVWYHARYGSLSARLRSMTTLYIRLAQFFCCGDLVVCRKSMYTISWNVSVRSDDG